MRRKTVPLRSARFLQRRIFSTGAQRPCFSAFDLQDVRRLMIDYNIHASTAITIIDIRAHPLIGLELRPIAFGLMSTLRADYPLAVAVVQPCVAGSWITKPPTARFDSAFKS